MIDTDKLQEATINFGIKTIEAITMVVATCLATEATNRFFDNLHEACEPPKKKKMLFNFNKNKVKNTKR